VDFISEKKEETSGKKPLLTVCLGKKKQAG
jgi:hypothetical protein